MLDCCVGGGSMPRTLPAFIRTRRKMLGVKRRSGVASEQAARFAGGKTGVLPGTMTICSGDDGQGI